MINPFVWDYQTRLAAWKQCRQEIQQNPCTDSALDTCLEFWRQAPLENHLLNWDDDSTWPTAWEMLKENSYCTSMHSLGIAETLRLSDDRWTDTQLWLIRDTQAHVEKIICVTQGWALNHGHVDKQCEDRLQHVHKQCIWRHTGKQWQLM